MKWEKRGLVFTPANEFDWMVSHASIPVADSISDDRTRIYFGTRDRSGRSHTSFIVVAADDPSSVLQVHSQPILSMGAPGTFDDSGIMPSWMVEHQGLKYLYYIGWNAEVAVPYRLSIGVAISEDGVVFKKYSVGPICDRAIDEPFFNTAPCVMLDNGIWRMWYVSCTGWEVIDRRPEPHYHVKYAESNDGIHWHKTGKVCVDYDDFAETLGRPCVYREDNIYKMIYSYRSAHGYRTDKSQSYRLGYAESKDGIEWLRKDNEVGIERSENGWDSEMIEYCYRHLQNGNEALFYNGNGFGRTGFGYAMRQEDKVP
jgi:hypothetical protein